MNASRPAARAGSVAPPVRSGGASIRAKAASAADKPRCSGPLTSARCFNGVISISIAVMNETKPPMVVWFWLVWISAMTITIDNAQAAMTCVIGTVAAKVLLIFRE